MPTDPKIREAIEEAVRNANQPSTLAAKIVAWFEAMASGNERVDDTAEADRHLELLYAEAETRPTAESASTSDPDSGL